ncbi:hybrid sensor histidine kinase/response regulator [Natronomonas marina]|jgi:PAS domain S-box-containing protein|uniref:hybrid sensor histidine kinase/response regulator n=1 Tax=Natronomonas marina TaxID=2961939 RepID=UPI0020C9D513|nr:PAS domain S-box protein [Natronomonas marina]
MSGWDGSIDVLHVDDDPGLTEVAARFLEREDSRLDVETTTGAREALDRLADREFDCVVSDYDMPRMDGLELFESVRETHPDLPFILFTGKGSEAVAGEAVSVGVTDYLQKGAGTEQYGLLANRITNAVSQFRAERRLEAEHRRFHVLFERLTQPTVEVELDGETPVVRRVNPAFEEVFGYSADEIVGESLDEYIVPDDREEEARRINRRVRDGGRIFSKEVTRVTADGEREFLLQNAVYREGSAGFAIYTDVTGRAARKRELERKNTRLAALFENFPEPTVAYRYEDDEPHVVDVNEAFVETFGYDEERAVGEPIDDLLVPPDRHETAERIDERVRAGETVDEHLRRRTADGVREFRFRNVRLVDDETIDGYAIYADVTERAEELTTLRQLQHRAQGVIRANDRTRVAEIAVDVAKGTLDLPFAGVHFVDDEGAVLEPVAVTDEGRDRAGEAPAYERTDPDRTIDRVNWGVFESGDPAVVDDLREYEAVDETETPTRSGVILPLDDHGILFAASPEPNALTESDRHLADILATILTAVLDRAERERALHEQKRLLEDRTDRLDELVSVISHDLRSPLNVAKGRLDLARNDCESAHLEDAAGAVERSRAIVEDLLALAREGDRATETGAVSLAPLVEDCWQNVPTGRATLSVETDRTVEADRSRLRQLLENLVGNSVEHGSAGEDGGVTVTVGAVEDGFFVADDGPGIPPDDRADVFESGYSTGEDGTGLGLSIVEQVAREHGWEVALTESDDGGVHFEFTGVEFVDD